MIFGVRFGRMQTEEEWADEVIAFGCYRCGHEASDDDPCDPGCNLMPLSWSQMMTARCEERMA